ncbi:GNAT family N-acetyltransferase [Calidifontibacter terrae]
MKVTTWTLEQRVPAASTQRPAPDGVEFVDAPGVTPEYARFLYALVGGPWRWTDRLRWSRQQWVEDLAAAGTRVVVAYEAGQPVGYVHLGAADVGGSTEVEIKYFGLTEGAIGRGIGSALLSHGVECAWATTGLPPVSRVWVHTCSLDGPAALSNYQRRGFELIDETITEEDYPAEPLGAWASTTGAGLTDAQRWPSADLTRARSL